MSHRSAPRSLLLGLLFCAACGSDRFIAFDSSDDDDDDDDGGGWDLGDDTGSGSGSDGGGSDGGGSDGGGSDGGGSDGGGSDGGGSDGGSSDEPVQPGELVISELMIDPTAVSDEDGEWVELYNASDRSIQLQGLVLGDEGVDWWVLEDRHALAPGAFAVLCAVTASGANGGATCDGSFHQNTWGDGFALANGGDEVLIARDDGTIIDRVAYADGFALPGVAVGVKTGRLDADDNDSSSAWCDQQTPMSGGDLGTPGKNNDGC